jgi:hypothetical protein
MSSMDNLSKLAKLLSSSSTLMQFFINTANDVLFLLNKIGSLKAVEVERVEDGYVAVLEGSSGKLRIRVTIELE